MKTTYTLNESLSFEAMEETILLSLARYEILKHKQERHYQYKGQQDNLTAKKSQQSQKNLIVVNRSKKETIE